MRKARSGKIFDRQPRLCADPRLVLGWYASARHAFKGMTGSMRMELRDFAIDVIQIEPGEVRTGCGRGRKSARTDPPTGRL